MYAPDHGPAFGSFSDDGLTIPHAPDLTATPADRTLVSTPTLAEDAMLVIGATLALGAVPLIFLYLTY